MIKRKRARLGSAVKGRGRVPIARGSEEKVNRVAHFVDGAVEVGPFPANSHIGLVHTPASTHRTLSATERFLKLRRVFDHPAVPRGMIHSHSSLAHHFLKLPIGDGIRDIPPYGPPDNLTLELTPLKINHTAPPPPHKQR